MKYHPFAGGRYVLRLDPGEEVVASLTAFALEAKVSGAWISGLGSLDHAVLGFLDPKEGVYLKRTFDERMEIGTLTGNIGMNGAEPFVHLHAVLSPRELLAYTGHLHQGRVGVVVEVLVTVLEGGMRRIVDAETGFGRLLFPGEASVAGEPPRASPPTRSGHPPRPAQK